MAEFRNPVMLYSIGKDSSAMLHMAQKAFAPAKPPFPLLHVDTMWKFREMIAFRDEIAARLGMDLLVHVNEEGLAGSFADSLRARRFTPSHEDGGSAPGVDKWKFDAAFGGHGETKRRAGQRSAFSRIAPPRTVGSAQPTP